MFSVESLRSFFAEHAASAYLLAYSGGLDSHVLLHACAALRQQLPHLKLRALHIDHGLQAVSGQWAEHCQQVCSTLDVPVQVIRLQLQPVAGESTEALARAARYQAFASQLQAGEMLLTAHHRDDQAETLLLNLLRGAGVDGLAAMPVVRPFHAGQLGRPLLTFGRDELEVYAHQSGLDYIDDPSNASLVFDRNFLRHEIVPRLSVRWPAVTRNLARATQWQQESRYLLARLLAEKLPGLAGSQPNTLSLARLLEQDTVMRKAVLRHWLGGLGFMPPSEKKLHHVLQDVLLAGVDATPCVSWAGCEVRRYRDDVYALEPVLPIAADTQIIWADPEQPLFHPVLDRPIDRQVLGAWYPALPSHSLPVTIRFRRGGEQLRYRGQTRDLKQLLQEAAIPPWERGRLPLVYVGEELVQVLRMVAGANAGKACVSLISSQPFI